MGGGGGGGGGFCTQDMKSSAHQCTTRGLQAATFMCNCKVHNFPEIDAAVDCCSPVWFKNADAAAYAYVAQNNMSLDGSLPNARRIPLSGGCVGVISYDTSNETANIAFSVRPAAMNIACRIRPQALRLSTLHSTMTPAMRLQTLHSA